MSWPKQLTVDKRIVLLLSASTYENFPRALRELVSNAYDADATSVTISIRRDEQTIVITDNGSGMTPDEFDFFLRIAGKHRSQNRRTELGRVRIGQFGIGFLAMFPFCETIEVESTIAGSPIVFVARIPASQFFQPTSLVSDEIADRKVSGSEHEDPTLRSAHYTRITMIGTTALLDQFLNPMTVEKKRNPRTIRSFSGMERLKWELQDMLPLPYAKDSLIHQYIEQEALDFNVSLNGSELVANEYVSDVLKHSNGLETIGRIQFTWVIGTSWQSIHPDEARGLRVRLHRVGVGPRQYFDLGIAGRTFSRLHWLSGEVNIVSGLDDAITVDRDSFTQSHDYDEFREFFRSNIRKIAYYVEHVDEAKRKIVAQVNKTSRALVAPTDKVIDKQVEELKRRGFTAKYKNELIDSENPVNIDVASRTITLSTNALTDDESVLINGNEWKINYDNWDTGPNIQDAYRISDKRTITLNQDYELFNGTHKDVFKKIHIAIAYADHRSTTKRQFLKILQHNLLSQFRSDKG